MCPEMTESGKIKNVGRTDFLKNTVQPMTEILEVTPSMLAPTIPVETAVVTSGALIEQFLQSTDAPHIETETKGPELIVFTPEPPTNFILTTLSANQNFFNFLANNSLFQGLVGGQAGVDFLQNLLSGKDLISALFPNSNIVEEGQINLGNLFAGLG